MMNPQRTVSCALVVLALAACSGNFGGAGGAGTGIGGLSGPVAPNQSQPNGASVAPLDRQKTLEATVPYDHSSLAMTLPAIAGFSVAIDLATPEPKPSGSPGATGMAAKSRKGLPSPGATAASPTPVTSGSPSATPSGGASLSRLEGSGRPLLAMLSLSRTLAAAAPQTGDATAPATASSAPTGPDGLPVESTPATDATPAASKSPSHVKKGASPEPSPTGPVIEAKLTIYPDRAPKPPDPKIKSPVARRALVRGYFKAPEDLTLASLAAVKFTIPSDEASPNRGFTVGFYEARKKKDVVMAVDTEAVLTQNVVSGASGDPIVLHKGTGYSVILFADEVQAVGPAASYPPPGAFPGATAAGATVPGASGAPQPAGSGVTYGTPSMSGTLPPGFPPVPNH